MKQDLYTELTTINDKTLQIDVYTDNNIDTEHLTFTSKLSLTKYLDRLRKNLYKTDIPICIKDTIRNITVKFNLDTQGSTDMSVICFSSTLFKEILVANKDAESGRLEVSSAGLARVTFKGKNYTSTYYLVQLQTA